MNEAYYEFHTAFPIDRYEAAPLTEIEEQRVIESRRDGEDPYSLHIEDNGVNGDGLFILVRVGMSSRDSVVWIPIPEKQISNLITALKAVRDMR